MRKEGAERIELLLEASKGWQAKVQGISEKTLFPLGDSW
jgi:hypothetical protein